MHAPLTLLTRNRTCSALLSEGLETWQSRKAPPTLQGFLWHADAICRRRNQAATASWMLWWLTIRFCCSMGEIMIHDHLSCHPTRFGRRHLLQTSFDCAQLHWLARQGFDLLQRSDGCRCGRAARLVPKGRTTKVDTLDGLTVSDDRHSLQALRLDILSFSTGMVQVKSRLRIAEDGLQVPASRWSG